MLEDIPIVPIK